MAGGSDDDFEDLGGVSAAAWRSQAAVEIVKQRIQPYLDVHRETFVDRWLDWTGDDATLVVAFTTDVREHQAALGDDVRVVERKRNLSELKRVAGELWAFVDGQEGAVALGTWPHPVDDVAYVEAVTADPDGLRHALAERFGNVAALEWLGPDEYVDQAVAFTDWSIAADDRTITVHWLGGGSQETTMNIQESADIVAIALSEPTFVGARTLAGVPSQLTGVLEAPLAGRRVLDASTGELAPDDPLRPDPEREADLMSLALTRYGERDFVAALAAFDALADEFPDALKDATLARKHRIATLQSARLNDA